MSEGALVHDILVIIHVIGAILGVGGASVVDYLHLRGLKNRKFERRVITVYPSISSLIIIGLIILVTTGTLLVLLDPAHYLSSELFRLKMAIVAIIIVNGYFLNKKVFPKIMQRVHEKDDYPEKRKLIVITSFTGAVSLVSWYSAFIIAMTMDYGYSYKHALVVYILMIAVVFAISMLLERRSHHASKG